MSPTVRFYIMYFMASFYIIAGVLHFVNPDFYLKLMPRYLPYHLELIYLSGVAEIICGLLLFFKRTQALGAWLTIALLIAVFPANIQMAQDFWASDHPGKYFALLRLPLQFVLIYWVSIYRKPIEHRKLH